MIVLPAALQCCEPALTPWTWCTDLNALHGVMQAALQCGITAAEIRGMLEELEAPGEVSPWAWDPLGRPQGPVGSPVGSSAVPAGSAPQAPSPRQRIMQPRNGSTASQPGAISP